MSHRPNQRCFYRVPYQGTGIPAVVARNMPGAGGVIASNYLYTVAPQDGTSLAIITSSFANEDIFGNPQIKYEARKFNAVGRLLEPVNPLGIR